MMIELLLTCACGVGAFGTYFASKQMKEKQVKIFKHEYRMSDVLLRCISVILFFAFMPHLFGLEIISNQVGLDGGVFSSSEYVFAAIIDWLTVITIAASILSPFFYKRSMQDFCSFIAVAVIIINIIGLKTTTVSILGELDLYNWRIFLYEGLLVLVSMICGSSLIKTIATSDFAEIGKRIVKMFLFMLCYAFAFMPIYFPQLILGHIGQETDDFTVTHRIFIYISVVVPITIYFVMRNKPIEERHLTLVLLSLSGFIQYFAYQPHRSGSGILPLHLCNTAIVLMFFAYAFKIKSLYYFTYFINVLGALCAIILPNTVGVWTKMSNMVFWYNHWYAFFLPLLGVALGIFKRPNLAAMGRSLIVFGIYVVMVAFINAYVNSPLMADKYSADYFFLYGDFFVNKFMFVVPLKYDYVWKFVINGVEMQIYYVYVFAIFIVFIGLTFLMWYFYTTVFNISDAHRNLAKRKKMRRVDRLNLLKELDGRPINSPLHPEGVNMIKINNFSKTYSGSDRKSVDGLNLEIHDGEVFGFIGHNGAGKSTTIKSLVGIQSITEGSIEIAGYDIARQPLEAKLNIGYVSDNHALYEKLTGREYISYVADLYMVSEKDKNERIEKYVKMFQLEHAIDNEIKSYSHGMKQKTMVIAALIHNPKVWVLDEPLTGLDPTSAYQIKECMRQHADAGNIVFFSSHVIEVVEKICDRIAIISNGKLRRVSTIEELKSEGISLEQLYLQYAQNKNGEDMQVNMQTENNGAV